MKSQYPLPSPAPAALPAKALANHPKLARLPHLTTTPPAKVASRDLAWQIAPDLLTSFRYAWAGVCYAYVTQRNFRIHIWVGSLALATGLALRLSPTDMAILSLTVVLVMILELLNTALESVVDLTVGQSYHELAKIAKDCAAGAVLLAAIAAVIVGGCLLATPVLALIFSVWGL